MRDLSRMSTFVGFAKFDHPSAEDIFGAFVVFRCSLGDVDFGAKEKEFDREFVAVFVEELLVCIVGLFGKVFVAKTAMQDDLEKGGDGAVCGNVCAEAAHFPVSVAEEVSGCRCFGIAD